MVQTYNRKSNCYQSANALPVIKGMPVCVFFLISKNIQGDKGKQETGHFQMVHSIQWWLQPLESYLTFHAS